MFQIGHAMIGAQCGGPGPTGNVITKITITAVGGDIVVVGFGGSTEGGVLHAGQKDAFGVIIINSADPSKAGGAERLRGLRRFRLVVLQRHRCDVADPDRMRRHGPGRRLGGPIGGTAGAPPLLLRARVVPTGTPFRVSARTADDPSVGGGATPIT